MNDLMEIQDKQAPGDGRLKAGRLLGSPSTAARPMRQLTLAACLSPLTTAAAPPNNSPSVAAPAAAPRPAAPDPSTDTASNLQADGEGPHPQPRAPVKRRLNLASPPPRPSRKSVAHYESKVGARKLLKGARRLSEAAPATRPRPHGFFQMANQGASSFGAVGPQTTVDLPDARSTGGTHAAPVTAAAAANFPAELDRVGCDGTRLERIPLLPAGARLAESHLEPGDQAGEEQQGESADPTQQPQEQPATPAAAAVAENGRKDRVEEEEADEGRGRRFVEHTARAVMGTEPGLMDEAVQRLAHWQPLQEPQRRDPRPVVTPPVGLQGRPQRLRSTGNRGNAELKIRGRMSTGRRSTPRRRGWLSDSEADASEDEGRAFVVPPGGADEILRLPDAQDAVEGATQGRRDAALAGDRDNAGPPAAVEAVEAEAVTRAAPTGRPMRAAAQRAKERMKAGAGALNGMASQLASETVAAQDAAGAAAAVARPTDESRGRRFYRTCESSQDDPGKAVGQGGAAGALGAGGHNAGLNPREPRAPAAAKEAIAVGDAPTAIYIDSDGLDSEEGDILYEAEDDDSGGGGAAAQAASADRPAGSHGGRAAASSEAQADEQSWEERQPASSLKWQRYRPAYLDLAVAVEYRRASQWGELGRPADLPTCWGVGLLGDKPVFCNTLLHGSAGAVVDAAIRAALQGQLWRLQESKLVRVTGHELLSTKQARYVQQQFEERLRRAAARRMAEVATAAAAAAQAGTEMKGSEAGVEPSGGAEAPTNWRTMTHAQVLEYLPEVIPPSRKVEQVYIGGIGPDGEPVPVIPSPWDDVPAMRGHASLRVRPGHKLVAGEFIGIYCCEGWLYHEWQDKIRADPMDPSEWDDPHHRCPYTYSAARKHAFGRYAADCDLPDGLLKHLHDLDLQDERLRMLLEQEPGKCGRVFLTAARLGCPMAAANDPRRNTRAMCVGEADFRAGGPNAQVVTVVVLGILPVLVMVAVKNIPGGQHVMYSYGHDYWELHEDEQVVCNDMDKTRAEALAELKNARSKTARYRRHRCHLMAKLEKAVHERTESAQAAAAALQAAKQREEEEQQRRLSAEMQEEAARLRLDEEQRRRLAAEVQEEEARRREEEEQRRRLAAEVQEAAARQREEEEQRRRLAAEVQEATARQREEEERQRRLAAEVQEAAARQREEEERQQRLAAEMQEAAARQREAEERQRRMEAEAELQRLRERMSQLLQQAEAVSAGQLLPAQAPEQANGVLDPQRSGVSPPWAPPPMQPGRDTQRGAVPASAGTIAPPAPVAGPAGGADDAADAAGGLLRGLGSPLGKRTRRAADSNSEVAAADLGSPTARPRTAASLSGWPHPLRVPSAGEVSAPADAGAGAPTRQGHGASGCGGGTRAAGGSGSQMAGDARPLAAAALQEPPWVGYAAARGVNDAARDVPDGCGPADVDLEDDGSAAVPGRPASGGTIRRSAAANATAAATSSQGQEARAERAPSRLSRRYQLQRARDRQRTAPSAAMGGDGAATAAAQAQQLPGDADADAGDPETQDPGPGGAAAGTGGTGRNPAGTTSGSAQRRDIADLAVGRDVPEPPAGAAAPPREQQEQRLEGPMRRPQQQPQQAQQRREGRREEAVVVVPGITGRRADLRPGTAHAPINLISDSDDD